MSDNQKNRILCVDDDPGVTRALSRCLTRRGWLVTACNCPAQALADSEGEAFDLIISDYRMPEMSGLDFLRRMKQRQPHAIRIMLSAHADIDGVIAAVNEAEIFRFMVKPWNDDDLVLTVSQAVAMKQIRCENRQLADAMRQQQRIINRQNEELVRLEVEHPGITRVSRDAEGYIDLSGADEA